MKLRKTSSRLLSAIAVTLFMTMGLQSAQAQSESSTVDLSGLANAKLQHGNWFWELQLDATEGTAVTALAADKTNPSHLFMGGPGYISYSSDTGNSWKQVLNFESVNSTETEYTQEVNLNDPQVAAAYLEAKKNYLREELENEFEQSFVDSLLDKISDEDLLQAKDCSELDEIAHLELDIEFGHITDSQTQNINFELPEHEPFAYRYHTAVLSGAEADVAIQNAANSTAVWDFVTTSNASYAITSDTIYYSTNHGETWLPYTSANLNSAFLSFAVSSSNTIVLIGTTEGAMISSDSGSNWVVLNDILDGAAFDMHVVEDTFNTSIWILTTQGIYRSTDKGLTWQMHTLALEQDEMIVDITPVGSSNLLIHSNNSVYLYENGAILHEIELPEFLRNERIAHVTTSDSKLSSLYITTSSGGVYEYSNNQLKTHFKGLNTSDAGKLLLLPHQQPYAFLATSSGIWSATDSVAIEADPAYQALLKIWQSEPSDDLVIAKALEAHFLDDWIDKRWGLRSRLAWLLPRVSFDYYHEDRRNDEHKTVSDMRFGVIESESFTYKRRSTDYWQIMAYWRVEFDQTVKYEFTSYSRMISLIRLRAQLIKTVQYSLKTRKAIQINLALKKKTKSKKQKASATNIKKTLQLQEHEAMLNALTNGFYLPAIGKNNND